MEKLSKKQKFRLEKQKAKLKKKIITWSIIILLFSVLSIWIYNSAKNSPNFSNPIVNSDQVPSGLTHWHPKLEIKINGNDVTIPNDIGISPGRESPTHTHEEGDGTIHIENNNPKGNPETMSLGYFFNQWREPFNETCILNKCTNIDGGKIKMYVNGKENFEFENYIFKGDDKILIEYTSK